MSDPARTPHLSSALSALHIGDRRHVDTATPSQPLSEALSALQITDAFERMRPPWKAMAALGVPRHLITFRAEVLDILDRQVPRLDVRDVSLEQVKVTCQMVDLEDALIMHEHRRVLEGMIGWYRRHRSELSPEACSQIELFFLCMRDHAYCRTVKW